MNFLISVCQPDAKSTLLSIAGEAGAAMPTVPLFAACWICWALKKTSDGFCFAFVPKNKPNK